MKALLKNDIAYLAGYLLLFAAMVAALVCVQKADLHFWLNDCHTQSLDAFFRGVTYLAQWPIYALMLCFIVRRYSVVAYYLAAELSATVVVQVIKGITNMPRPIEFFGEGNAQLQQILVEGVRMNHWHSFPSGHTQTFFVCATVLALLAANRTEWKPLYGKVLAPLGLLLIAALGGYSRIYLSQHFALDVCVGSLIGVVVPILLWPVFLRFEKKWSDRGLCYRYFANRNPKS